MPEIKPCPKCGNTEFKEKYFGVFGRNFEKVFVGCPVCKREGKAVYGHGYRLYNGIPPEGKRDAIKAWNRGVK